ncbi:phosphatidylglycerophosphatase A [Xanthomonadaceae bacterium XH05]|nr:phosphatidylglycerophosphatase A [Xanthomonadaceae bacterium XH05]
MSRRVPGAAKRLLVHPAGWIATGFGSGLAPVAPGTFGSLAALIPWLALRELPLPYYALALIGAFVVGAWACQWTIRRLGVEDPGLVVWDEFVGLWIALAMLPDRWYFVAAGFALFRFFDIVKPWPVRWADRKIKGGLGTMLDDVLAGVYALLCVQALAWFVAP